jgi:hypothetical protein
MIMVLVMSVIVVALVLLALFLPPVSLWNVLDNRLNDDTASGGDSSSDDGDRLRFTALTAESARVERDGLVIAAEPGALTAPFGVHIKMASPADYLAEKTPTAGWYCETTLPSGHALVSPVYSLTQTGTPPDEFTIQISALPEATSDPAALELNLWNPVKNAWEFWAAGGDANGTLSVKLPYLPRCLALFRESESTRRVGVTLGLLDPFAANVMAANVRLYPGSLRPTQTGALQVVLAPGFQTGQGYDVLPLLQNFDDPAVIDGVTVQRILENAVLRTEHARQIAAFILSDPGYTGVVLDYREVSPGLRDAYTAFLGDLADLLHSQNRTLTVVLPMPIREGDAWNTGAYDWPAVGRIADEVVITAPLDPQAYAPGGLLDVALTWAATQISRGKMILGLNALSVEDQGGAAFAPISLAGALNYLGHIQLDPAEAVEAGQTVRASLFGVQAEIGLDETSQTPYVRYLDSEGNTLRTMWITTPETLYFRLGRATGHRLGGVFVRDLMSPGAAPGVTTALVAYRLDQPLTLRTSAALEWIVYDGDDAVAETSSQLFEPFIFTPDPNQKTLIIEVRAFGQAISRQALRVIAPEPTITPTLEPTVTPTPEPTTTPEAPIMPTPAEAATSAPELSPTPAENVESLPPGVSLNVTPVNLSQPLPVVDPALLALPTIGQDFEVGVQMGSLSSDVIFAGRMHTKWIKFDLTYLLGQDPADQQTLITNVQANGFKVLLNVTGDPFEFIGTDRATYIAAYASYVGGLAAGGADGIEIWREMNGRMTPDDYIQLLAYATQAIKTARPTTLVITGALRLSVAPEDSDSAYYARLAEVGVARAADCIGAQYVLGTVAPASASGDLRGDSPIYYLPTASDGPRAAAGGVRPICYTRLGYLSPEGYTALPEEYAWAQNTTAALQAQWLAEAIRLIKEGAQVRLVIIWSLDAGYFGGGSPEAGYAVIRPDGTCPACDLIEPILKTPGT